MSQTISNLQLEVLAIMQDLHQDFKVVNDMDIGDRLRDRGVHLTRRHASYPAVCLSLGKLKRMGLVERLGGPSSWGNWRLTDEGKFLADDNMLPY